MYRCKLSTNKLPAKLLDNLFYNISSNSNIYKDLEVNIYNNTLCTGFVNSYEEASLVKEHINNLGINCIIIEEGVI